VRITLRLAVVLCALAAIVLPSTASAWKYIGTTGSYAGSVYMPPVYPYEADRYTTYGPYLMFATFERPYIYRSPGWSGAQSVTGIYLINRWNSDTNQWYLASRQNTGVFTIPAGVRGTYVPKLWRAPGGNQLYNRGYFKVLFIVAWSVENGRGLGSTTLAPNRIGDLRCQDMVRPCSATAEYVRLGRTYATGGGW